MRRRDSASSAGENSSSRLRPGDAPLLQGNPRDACLHFLGIAPAHGGADKEAPADHAHRRPTNWSKKRHHQRMRQRSKGSAGRSGGLELGVDVLHHRRRLRNQHPIVHHGRDRAVRVDLQVLGSVLVEAEQVDIAALERHSLLVGRQDRLAGVGVGLPVVDRQHGHRVIAIGGRWRAPQRTGHGPSAQSPGNRVSARDMRRRARLLVLLIAAIALPLVAGEIQVSVGWQA